MFDRQKFSELLDAPVSRPDPKSIQGLIAWLETQDGTTAYDMWSVSDCLICRFASHIAGNSMGFSAAHHLLGTVVTDISKIAYGPTSKTDPEIHNYTAARARAYAASQVAK